MMINPKKLLVKVKEAAEMTSLSTRTLWTLTNRGELPAVRIGRAVRYSVDDLRDWIARRRG
jgi:excisionase family DNA binding protein